MPSTITLDPDIAEYIGDGSEHAEQMPGYAASILDEIAQAGRDNLHPPYIVGLTGAYGAVMRHRFKVTAGAFVTVGFQLIDTWTGDSPIYVPDRQTGDDQCACANQRNADVFVGRIDRYIAEGGL